MNVKKNVTLWVVQGLLAALFLFAGVMKLVVAPEAMAGPVALPTLFLRFIGVAETLGAIVVTVIGGAVAPAAVPLIVGVLALSVALGRSQPAQAVTA
jgi:hypothetical protein